MSSSKESFAAIYAQWEKTHDEQKIIAKRALNSFPKETVTVSELKKMKVQDELDLHNVLSEQAAKLACRFVLSSYNNGLRKIRIITGKGLHSPNGQAVVRPKVLSAVQGLSCIRELNANPKPCDGGSGAIIIILKSNFQNSLKK